MDDKNQKTEEKVSEVTDASEEPVVEETTESNQPEEASSPVIASETEGETKQSSTDEEDRHVVPQSGTPRDDEEINKDEAVVEESTKEPEAQVNEPGETPAAEEPTTSDEPTPATHESTEPQESASPTKNDNPNAKWYVVHTYSGHENKVAHTLKQRVESEHLEEKILEILVPMQDKIEIKGGKKVNVKEKIFPGYILVKMVLDDISWLVVRTTQGVTAFVGIGNKPTPISEAEVQTIVKFTQTEAPMYKQVFAVSDAVKIVDGPFADFIGKIDSVDEEKGKVRVLVSIFGRETPVELDFLQVQKL